MYQNNYELAKGGERPVEHTMFESSTMLLGYHVGEAHGLNDISTLLTVLVKHYIHVNKCLEKRPTRQGILIYVKDVSKTEGHIYRNTGKNMSKRNNLGYQSKLNF